MNALLSSPTPEQERPRVWVSLCVAIACFGLGLALVYALPRTAPHVATVPRIAPASSAPKNAGASQRGSAATTADAPDRAPSPNNAIATSQPAVPPVAVAVSQAVNAAEASDEGARTTPTPESNVTAARAAVQETPDETPPGKRAAAERNELRAIQGRVAYLRCDGLSGERGRFPCPRDVALEQTVWEILGTLPKCSPSLGRGGADVRLDMSRDQPTQSRVLAIHGAPEPALDTDRVQACVGARLSKLKTSLDPLYMMVSFRVVLR